MTKSINRESVGQPEMRKAHAKQYLLVLICRISAPQVAHHNKLRLTMIVYMYRQGYIPCWSTSYLLIQTYFQALQLYSWGFALIKLFRNKLRLELEQ